MERNFGLNFDPDCRFVLCNMLGKECYFATRSYISCCTLPTVGKMAPCHPSNICECMPAFQNALFYFLFKAIVKVDCSKSRNLRDVRDSRRRSSRSRFFDTWGRVWIQISLLASFTISIELKIQTHANQSNYVPSNIFIAFLNFSCVFSLKKQFDCSEVYQIDSFQIIDLINWLSWKSVFKYLRVWLFFFLLELLRTNRNHREALFMLTEGGRGRLLGFSDFHQSY